MRNILPQQEMNEDKNYSQRPKTLVDFIGQNHIKHNLSVFISAAKSRSESLDHILLYGPPGLGKTSLAHIVSRELGVNLKTTSGPILSKAADLAAILTNLSNHDVLFIDEIHRLNTNIEEVLYSAMEDFVLDVMIGEGHSARSLRIDLDRFTLIGATTRLGLLSNPLRDRFFIPIRLDYYHHQDLIKIICKSSEIFSIALDLDAAKEIALRSRGTPRIALRLLKRTADFALVYKKDFIDKSVADMALNYLEVDKVGLDKNDFRYLRFIYDNYEGGPVGVDTIAAGLSEQKDAIEDFIEPYLIQIGFLSRTSKGRLLTKHAISHIRSNITQNQN
ncbi:Holliday junction branch migration DNA helicase RuvB [Rickettsia endosymbiont of Cardiosporidium cionae]|uniref:Holliday junction branch migration DNA helicase RuvB n=1 Tax=Rickettsia endosymbiont of Cardiosporidium cionae TaxID=2777155 RepID=UPI001895CA33|nr:Holliday junction branch migration DNA helicase RuvB [Rickettsia endosymbiont of Cardiosporidium cionae]KAF8818717.1 Holliday junction branch migration DNA helicase RuvB [Rickettsia endosymbiont of Cardiosporidium cionae]